MATIKQSIKVAHPTLVLVDILHGGVAIQHHEQDSLSEKQLTSLTLLRAPSSAVGANARHPKSSSNAHALLPFEAARATLELIRIDHAWVIFGSNTDPFFPFHGKFDHALQVLEQIAGLQPARLIVQTTSPLVLLATPLLRGLGDRSMVTIAIDTIEDALCQSLTPGLPRPSERIHACRALSVAGISTIAQLAPAASEAELLRYVHVIKQTADFFVIAEAYANQRLCQELHRILRRQAPERLLTHVAQLANDKSHDIGSQAA